jgi:hypothetical protein
VKEKMGFDPNRFRDAQELAELNPDERLIYEEAQTKLVFGANYTRDPKTGLPQEQGIGSPGRESQQHLAELQKQKERISRLKAEAKLAEAPPP